MLNHITKIEKIIWGSVQNESRIGLLEGLSGIALFYKYLVDSNIGEGYDEKLLIIIDKINTLISEEVQTFSLCSGLAGYGWMLLNFKSQNIKIEEEYFEAIDLILMEDLLKQSKINNNDFMHGAMGIAMYFIERCKENKNHLLVDTLNNFAKDLCNKIQFNIKDVLTRNPAFITEKHLFFGIAHGVAGYINFLTYLNDRFKELKIDITEALKIAIDFLQSFKEYNSISK